MKVGRRGIRAGATVVVAAAIGQFMQGGFLPAGGGTALEASIVKAITPGSVVPLAARTDAAGTTPPQGPALPRLPDIPSALLQPGPALAARMAGLGTPGALPRSDADAEFDGFGHRCPEASLTLMPVGDEIAVDYADACRAGQTVTMEHAGLAFVGLVGDDGRLRMTLPNLMGLAEVVVAPEGRAPLRGAVVSLADARPRLVLRAARAEAMDLRVAGPGGPVAGTASLPGTLANGIVPVQVLTLAAVPPGAAVTLDIRVTAETCGRAVAAEVGIHAGGAAAEMQDIVVPMPDCTAIGDGVSVPLAPLPDDGRLALSE